MTQIDAIALKTLINSHMVKVIDGSWALDGTDMQALYLQEHIPGAYFFDLDAISDRSTDLPHMAPSPSVFAEAVGHMGISHADHVVIYDRQGLFSAARVWWTFRLMGHKQVQILRGGLPAWKAAGFQVTSDMTAPEDAVYSPQFRSDLIIDRDHVAMALRDRTALVLDARPAMRFSGAAEEPRPGLRSGHMPGSRNLPFSEVVENGALKPVAELERIFETFDASGKAELITSCGSGVTAAIISLALAETGRASRLYDGSWAEWGRTGQATPVVTS